MTESTVNPARQILEALATEADNIENMVVLYSMKGRPEEVRLGLTRTTSALWALGSLDYARWHIFNLITMVSARRAAEHEPMEDVVKRLKDENKLQ